MSSNIEQMADDSGLSHSQKNILKKHWNSKHYDRNGTGDPMKVLHRVFVPKGAMDRAHLAILCCHINSNTLGKFDYCVFFDGLYGGGHYPSDTFGYGDLKKALADLNDAVFHAVTGRSPD